jgi:hypothetical protein
VNQRPGYAAAVRGTLTYSRSPVNRPSVPLPTPGRVVTTA